MKARIDPQLAAQVQAAPTAQYAVIVRVEGDLDARQTELEADGLQITRRLWLIRGVACTAPGSALLTIASHEWVISIEPDMQIRTLDAK
ncbi:MAG: hypothetical protein HDKAJFGB_03350 [Anaerolineae bacterium]|nr:hypothetical protein [Anaerolineae bacterium]